MIASRRRFLFGAAASLLAAPAILRVTESLILPRYESVATWTWHCESRGGSGNDGWHATGSTRAASYEEADRELGKVARALSADRNDGNYYSLYRYDNTLRYETAKRQRIIT